MNATLTRTRTALAAVFFATSPFAAYAYQPDAPFVGQQEKHRQAWSAEDKEIDEKLAALEEKFGKKPNIVYILTDDIGWGELGWQGGRQAPGHTHAGTRQAGPRRDALLVVYAEPSCTPTRIAINTGRHPVRTGLLTVLWPGQTEGLSTEEVTIAEVLSEAGYHTAMWGEWHLGELPEHAPENQGYDYAYYGLYNGAPDAWPGSAEFYANNMRQATRPPFFDFPGSDLYKGKTGIELNSAGYVGEKGKERAPIPGEAGTLGIGRQEAFENESIKPITGYIKDKAKSDKPFFIYWASYALQIHGSEEFKDAPHVDHANAQASFIAMHNHHVRQLLDALKGEGIDYYNVMRNPGEKYGAMVPGLFAVTPLQNYIKSHMLMIGNFPHRRSETMPN